MSVGTDLHEDHARLDALFQDLVEASEADVASDVLAAAWSRLEDAVRAHFEAEERHLFPLMASSHPEEVEALLAEHAEILRRLVELDLSVDLHVVRHEALAGIVERLRAHAAHEDRTVYEWADALPAERRRPLREAVKRLLGR